MQKTRTYTVFLVDDHAVVRMGYRALLQHEPHLEIVGEAESGAEAFDDLLESEPNVAVVDISMKDMNGLELTRRLKQQLSDVRVLIVSIHDSSSYLRRAREAGADGYIVKGRADTQLVEGIETLLKGGTYFATD